MLWFVIGCLIPLASRAQSAATPEQPPVGPHSVIHVGVTSDSYPYGFIDSDGRRTGFTTEVLDAVARVMNLKLEHSPLPGQEVQFRFRHGEFDMLQALSQTAERENYAEFSVPFLTLQGVLFVRHGSGIRSISDLTGKTFAVIGRQSIGEQFIRDHDLAVDIVYVSSTVDALHLINSGQAAATFASNLTALSIAKRDKIEGIVPLGDPYPDYDIRHCFAVHRGDAQLLARLNEGLAILRSTGEFDQIYNHWFGQLGGSFISRERVVTYALWALAFAFLAAFIGLLQQRRLHRRISRQARELQDQKTLLQTLHDNMPTAMCLIEVSTEGHRLLTVNRQAEELFNRPADECTGKLLSEFPRHSEWIIKLVELLQIGLTKRETFREECLFALSKKRLLLTLVPIHDHDESASKPLLCVLAEDVTARRNLDNEIAQSRKLRAVGELVGGIAHEFNNLLTPIMLKVGQIQLDWSYDRALIEETKLISDTVHRAADLTKKLLTFGRKTDPQVEQLHLNATVASCFSLMRLTMDRRITWEQHIPEDLPPLYLSGTDLNQIILNLIINARDTLTDKLALKLENWHPTIRVEAELLPAQAIAHLDGTPSTRQISGWQRLSISDTGMGITTEVRERVFEPFFTTKEVGKGTGLGLATVWHLVTEISGRIEVESETGLGTTFHVYLPMLPCPARLAPKPNVEPIPAGTARIFLAEDDQAVADAIISALTRYGYSIHHLADGAQSWLHLKQTPAAYDLLILDVNMPGLDGIELAQRLRALPTFTGRIMIASGRLGSNDLREISDAKVDNVLRKPFAVDELLATVRQTLAKPLD